MSKRTIIIAEAGVNHNGSLERALSLVDCAAEAGVDFVKFQTFKAENIVNKEAQKADYQIKNTTSKAQTQFEMLKKLEMESDWYPALMKRCEEKGVRFLSTGFDTESIDFLDAIKVPFYKIPSGEITNKPYLQHIARKGKDIILSTGMAHLQEVKDAVEVIEKEGVNRNQITVLHCNTEYPTPMEDVNLLAMKHIAQELGVKVGYSDHTLGIEVPIAAVALGACVIEKHFTLDRNLPGPDHAASLEPEELKALVEGIRNIEKAIGGTGVKEPSKSEQKNMAVARKSLHAARSLQKGCVIKQEDLIALRPGTGISPMEIDRIIGRVLVNDVEKQTLLKESDLEP
ncbi:MAG: N-acetylneuraminate synthase [Bacteroidia bacterium]|jgi:N-acetylneuraminate synthase/N,N'-diacetyllegionaminate synthase|nr:N-acetylneuraminate synthase [Bacteroidia bacterium]